MTDEVKEMFNVKYECIQCGHVGTLGEFLCGFRENAPGQNVTVVECPECGGLAIEHRDIRKGIITPRELVELRWKDYMTRDREDAEGIQVCLECGHIVRSSAKDDGCPKAGCDGRLMPLYEYAHLGQVEQ